MIIREMTSKEINTCADIFSSAWNQIFPNQPRRVTVQEFSELTKDELILIALINKKVVGFIAIYEPESFIHHLFIYPEFQRQGVGTQLLREVIIRTSATELILKCNLENHGALSFYQTLRFKKTEDTGVDKFGAWVKLTLSKNSQ